MRREAHGGFGERSGETDREQSRHRAPGLLSGAVAEGYLDVRQEAGRSPASAWARADVADVKAARACTAPKSSAPSRQITSSPFMRLPPLPHQQPLSVSGSSA